MYRLKNHITFFLLLTLFSCSSNDKELHQALELNQNWKFTSPIYNQTYDATVPGSVHTDLFNNNLIPDPFAGNNENNLQWIDTVDWIYYHEFKTPTGLGKNDQIELRFKGLDTYADVLLNDSLLFSANNMFLPWDSKINQGWLKENNILKVVLKSPTKEDKKIYSKLPYKLPGEARVVARKAAYHYGWDWGPKYTTSGIWQGVEMHIWNTAIIRDIQYTIVTLNSDFATLSLHVSIESDKDFTGNIKINCPIPGVEELNTKLAIQKGLKNYEIKLEIKDPQLWWTHNLGDPFLYPFKFHFSDSKQLLDVTELQIGLRTIQLIREPDKYGESFYISLNDVPVFMKGANYIPQNSFPGIVTNKQYKKIITDVKSANMNMLRMWGGGIYEKDIFYELCDEAGILIWQDFMFANAMFPNDSVFIKNITNEANFQVSRLKKHPSIALWCGNNEIDEAWHHWGWPNAYSKEDSAEIWDNYTTIFHTILPGIVNTQSPEITYTSSSPIYGRGNPKSSYEGDNHYWYVWHDAYDFDWYNKVTGRFMSEFGFQSFPDMETIEYFDTSEHKSINSETILAHQKHWRGNFLINHHMSDYYPVPDAFEDYIYVSQLLQAEGIRTGILAQRRAKPFCMGSLYWQLNDCWPAISWSGISYSGKWKALHHFAKKDFKNIILNPYLKEDSLEIYIVSDSLQKLNADLKISLISFDVISAFSETIQIEIPRNTSTLVFKNSIAKLVDNNPLNKNFLLIELIHNQKIIDSRNIYFAKPKNLKLDKFNVQVSSATLETGYEINLNSKTLVKNIFIDLPFDGQLSDNFFDLLPGIEKKIVFYTTEDIHDIHKQIKFKSLNHIIN